MEITGKIYLFANKFEGKNGTFTRCCTNVSDTDKDGNVKGRVYFDVAFRGEKAPKKDQIEQLKDDCIYEIEVIKGFMGAKTYKEKTIPEIVILECKILDVKKVKKAKTEKKKAKPAKEAKAEDAEEEELPF